MARARARAVGRLLAAVAARQMLRARDGARALTFVKNPIDYKQPFYAARDATRRRSIVGWLSNCPRAAERILCCLHVRRVTDERAETRRHRRVSAYCEFSSL